MKTISFAVLLFFFLFVSPIAAQSMDLPPGVQVGIAVSPQMTPVEEFPYRDYISWHNWGGDNAQGCLYRRFMAMDWGGNGIVIPRNCRNNSILFGNELELPWQGNKTTPEQILQVAQNLHYVINQENAAKGVWCCGSYYDETGLVYTQKVLGQYAILYGEMPKLAGIHIHVYNFWWNTEFDYLGMLKRWRAYADANNYRILVSEAGYIGWSDQDTATQLPFFLRTVWVPYLNNADGAMRISVFSWRHCKPPVCQEDLGWDHTDLADANNNLTVIGQAIEPWISQDAYTAAALMPYQIYLPETSSGN